MTRSVAGILLAAGTSSRMGKNKLFLEIAGTTVLRRAARTALVAGLDPLLVVLGHESPRALRELDGIDCTPVFNDRFAQGMNTSLSAGIAAVPRGPAAAVVMLADMPFVTAEMVRAVVDRWKNEPLVVSLFGDVVAPPILYTRDLFSELRALDGDGCGKRVVKVHRAQALEVAQPEAALRDLDVPGDFERARSELEGG
jgi:molybdenum cofactor cytidylyltransferase